MPNTTILTIKDNWKKTWASPPRRNKMIIGTLLMLIVVFILPSFFGYIEKRKGVLLNDWILGAVPPHNVSILIFAVIWGMILLTTFRALYNPSIYISYCWTLMFVSVARLICISIVPLAPPIGLIPLTDPLTGVFYGNAVITKDLFFSGHTAILTLIFLCLEKRTDKIIAFFAVVAVAILLVVQHIHYTIDILAAPIIVYGLYRMTSYFLYKMHRWNGLQANLFILS
ncbi:MAG TPA: phosphatase PAP2-related protein [Mucilaginibacter sp.]